MSVAQRLAMTVFWRQKSRATADSKPQQFVINITSDLFFLSRLLALIYSFQLYIVRGSRPGKQVQLAEYEIKFLCTTAREIFINQPILLELEAPIKICGTVMTLFIIFIFFYFGFSPLLPYSQSSRCGRVAACLSVVDCALR